MVISQSVTKDPAMRKTFLPLFWTMVTALAPVALGQDGVALAAENPSSAAAAASNRYEGIFCAGEGDGEFLRLIDESFAFFHPNPTVPNLTMIYKPEWDTFVEGAGWGGWWIQNSYGFSYAATPFLQEPWFSTLQRSWDLF